MITQTSPLISLPKVNGLNGMVIGNRIPREYFVTKGSGESDITVHAGSYHLALRAAGIERVNIMTYSSIMPAIAQEIERPKNLVYGSVVECIMAVGNSLKGERVSAGIILGWLYDRRTDEKFGGLVCEHNGNYSTDEIKLLLKDSLNELYINGFEEDYSLKDKRIITESFIPGKKYGTALVALCFTDYLYPVLSRNGNDSIFKQSI
jgi:arginine decarboxylase